MTIINPKSVPHDGSHLTREQADTIEAYMRQILLALELNYWRVHVAKDLAPEDCFAMIHPTDGRRIAMLYLSADWWDQRDPEDKRTDLTHEALHLIHHDQEECIRRFVNDTGDVGSYPMGLVWGQFKTETERMVDGLSYLFAPLMPAWSDPQPKSKPKKRKA